MMDLTTFERVRGVLTQALSIESEEVTLDSSLCNDLGAESIDMLDITFRLEREFSISIKDEELFPTDIFNGNELYATDGVVTALGIAKLKEAIPYGDFSKIGNTPRMEEIQNVFTVNTLVQFVEGAERKHEI